MFRVIRLIAAFSAFSVFPAFADPAPQTDATIASSTRQALLGLHTVDGATPSGLSGALIKTVLNGSAAQRAGLRPGELVIRINDEAIDSSARLIGILRAKRPGDKITVTLRTENDHRVVDVVLGQAPEELTKRLILVNEKGQYQPIPGYKWVSDAPDDYRVVWAPGTVHSTDFPNTLAGDTVGNWRPAAGYRWLKESTDDLRTERIATYVSPTPTPSLPLATRGPSDDQIASAFAKIVAAAAAHSVAAKEPDGIGEMILVEIARTARDELIRSALADAFPGMSTKDRQTAANAASLALDGKLNVGNLRDRQAKDAIAAWLRKQNPGIGSAPEIADLLYRVMQWTQD